MKTVDIIEALAQKVIDTIYDEWHHDGYIEITHSDNFYFTLDGRTYKVTLEDIDCAGSPHQAAEAIEKLQSELEQVKAERETYKMFFDDVTGKPNCNDCGRLECEYRPKVGETTRFNCPLWRGVQGGKRE